MLNRAVESLKAGLGTNLHSCCLYGSAVRGNAIAGVSDINLLIVLDDSNPKAHQAVAEALEGNNQIDPFVLARRGFERSVRSFASKFASIRRNYRVLHGVDPLATIEIDPKTERFLCEQGMRNLRLRMIYSFVTRAQHKAYDRFLLRNVTTIFVEFAEALRLEGVTIPAEFEERIAIFEREFQIQGAALRELLALKGTPKRFSEADTIQWHERIFPLVETVLRWIEERWKL